MKLQFSLLFRRVWGVPLVAILVLLIGLAITAGVYKLVGEKNEAIAQARFDAYKAILVSRITHRLDDYAQVLHGAAGLFYASESVTSIEWKHYIDSLKLDKYYPGLELMGYLSVKPEKGKAHDQYATLVYEASTSPVSEKLYKPDASSSKIRQEAMDEARDQNNVAITKKLVLVQQASGQKQLGFLMLFPVYQKGAHLETLDDRRNALQGYVYSIFRSKDFMKEVTNLFDEYLEVNVYDGPAQNNKDLIYKSITHNEAEKVYAKFQAASHLLVGNHVWSLSATAKEKQGGSFYPDQPVSIWAFGIIMSVLFFVTSWMFTTYRIRIANAEKNTIIITPEKKAKEKLPLFLSKIFHELKTPLNSILVLSNVLVENRDKNLNQNQLKQVGVIHQSGSELLEMIDDVMDLARIKSGKLSVHFDKINIRDFADNVKSAFLEIAEQKSLKLTVSVDLSVPDFMYNDYKKTYQIIRNLCSNAIKFTEKGAVSIRLYLPSDMADTIAVSVTDTGCGIPREHMSNIFEPYVRGNKETDRTHSGSGLGLTISQELAHLLGGEISLSSEELKGSCFTIFLPMNSSLKGGQ